MSNVLPVIVLLLLAAAILVIRLVVIGRMSLRWPTAQGQVVSLLITTIGGGPHRTTTFRPSIRYRYRVEDKDYEGSRIALQIGAMGIRADDALSQAGAAKVLEGYFPGGAVAVRYNPACPGYSLLKPGASPGLYVASGALTFGAVALVVMGLLLAA
jgi:hypothetical protein